ncbi:hypothetical protein C8R43DRAFT_499913 [Mycena crocata]|nr:hypothetical protein C8R43DRAFT_499913 [Mycena crocata]
MFRSLFTGRSQCDDLESLAYLLSFLFHSELPWSTSSRQASRSRSPGAAQQKFAPCLARQNCDTFSTIERISLTCAPCSCAVHSKPSAHSLGVVRARLWAGRPCPAADQSRLCLDRLPGGRSAIARSPEMHSYHPGHQAESSGGDFALLMSSIRSMQSKPSQHKSQAVVMHELSATK